MWFLKIFICRWFGHKFVMGKKERLCIRCGFVTDLKGKPLRFS